MNTTNELIYLKKIYGRARRFFLRYREYNDNGNHYARKLYDYIRVGDLEGEANVIVFWLGSKRYK